MKKLLRRLFLLIAVLGLSAAALWGYMRYIEPKWIQICELEIAADFPGDMRVVAFGDTHIGLGNDVDEMEKLAGKINKLKPDVVLFLGDLFDDLSKYEGDTAAACAALAGIEARAKLAVRGNHDIGGGAEWVYPQLIADCGFTLLENADVWLDNGLHVVGSANYVYYTPNVQGFMTDGFDLLIAHEPDVADFVTGAELQLSGHSHGGQVYIPFLLDRILPKGSQQYYRGYYEKDDGGVVYVNRGIGMSLLPVRLFSRPEITLVTIRGEE